MDASHRKRLLAWYRGHQRDLPWRRTKDPYAILISEVMLQQTRVDTVLGHYGRWMERFPTLKALAQASEHDVLAQWSGLGYYRRARNLHAAAKVAVKAGGLPTTAAGLRELPGIGDYTAGAVASIAYGERVPCVDGNVVRVMARLDGMGGALGAAARKAITSRAAQLVPPAAGDWNQALMELGATVCTPRSPRCEVCPVAAVCVAREKGLQDEIPRLPAKKAAAVERRVAAVVTCGDKVLLVPGPDEGLLARLWAVPGGLDERDAGAWLDDQTGLSAKLERVGAVRHLFTHRAWHVEVSAGRRTSLGKPTSGARWVSIGELERYGVSTFTKRCLEAAGFTALG